MKIFKSKIIFTIFIGLLFFGNSSAIMPNLKLPFDAGESWQVTRGYENPNCLTDLLIKCTSHTNWGLWADDRYAIDMTEGGCGSWNKPALAIADGSIIQINNDNTKSYGRYVVIDHGDNYRSRYAHLNSISVTLNQKVSQGQEIGKVGNSGTGVVGTACPNHPGTHLHLALYHNGVAVKPVPMSGYTDFTEGQVYISDNHYVRFNFNDGTSQGWSTGRDTQYVQTVPNVWIVQVVDTDKDGVINPGVLSPVFGEGVTADRFPKLKFIVKINTQPLGIQQGDIWIETPDGNWNHQFTFTQAADNGNGFHTYQAQLTKELIINRFSIELTKDSADEKWEFDEIELIGKPSAPSGLTVK